MSGRGFIAEDPFHEACDLCGKVDELRPYGPQGEEVCFECAMKDEAAAKRGFRKLVLGASDESAGMAR